MDLIERIKNFVSENSLFSQKDKIVIGFSGGPDSTFLVLVLKENFKNPLVLSHLNHLLRGEDSFLDEIFVRRFSQKLKIPIYIRRLDIKKISEEKKMSVEEVGREERFKFFDFVLKIENGDKIALAHNFDDNIETILMNLLRGTGIKGLSGIQVKWGNLIHPILKIKKSEILNYLNERNIEYRIDKTNYESYVLRNKIRNELIPYIEKNINISFKDKLYELSLISKIEDEFLENLVEKERNKTFFKKFDYYYINIKEFKKLHKAIQRRVVRKIVEDFKKDLREYSLKNIDDVISLVEKRSGKEIHLPLNLIATKEKDKIVIEERKGIFPDIFIKIDTIKEIKDFGLKISMNIVDEFKKDDDNFTAYFDFDKISFPLYIRKVKYGDRFIPFGMKSSKKVQDFLTDLKVPKSVKWEIPIILDSKNDILWIIGLRISEKFKVNEMTKRILCIKIELEDNRWIKIYKRFS
jgi:tRNA(Ile)-lysidine synthase